MVTVFRPARNAPNVIPTASPSLVAPSEKRSERDPDCLAFACCAYVIQRRITDHVVDKRGKKGARYSGILRITKATQLIDERESADHDFKTPDSLKLRTLGLARDPRGRPRPAIVQ